jgi:hypothetical protein
MLLGDAAVLFSLLAQISRYGFPQKRHIPDTCVSPRLSLLPGIVKKQPVSPALLSSFYMLRHRSHCKDTKTFHFVISLYDFGYQCIRHLFRADGQGGLAPYALSGECFIDGDIFLHRYSTPYKLYIRHFASGLRCFNSFHHFSVEK